MRVPGAKTAMLAARWVRGRLSGGSLILGYHRVSESSFDPYGIRVSPRHFSEQMDTLRAVARPVRLGDVVEGLSEGRRARGSVAVTFDDGYADFVEDVEPVLKRLDVPATVFVVSGCVGRRFWWDELAHLVLSAPPLANHPTVDCGDGEQARVPLALDSPGARRATLDTMHRHMMALSDWRRAEVLASVREATGGPGQEPRDERALDPYDVSRLADEGLVEVGSHTVSHPPLAQLPESAQLRELKDSKKQLEEMTGRRVTRLSYPHGAAGTATLHLAREALYESACASVPDVVHRGSDVYRLPRFWVPDWDGDRFGRWLRRWLP